MAELTSPRSSVSDQETLASRPGTSLGHLKSSLSREILREEARTEKYGGDDIQDPPIFSEDQQTLPPQESLLVTWDGPDDPSNPQNWSTSYKWMITILCSLMTINVTFASSAPTSAIRAIINEFDISQEVAYLVTSTFLLGYIFGPLLWGPGSELFGRRIILVATLTSYTLFHLGQALAKNIETLLITRFFGGLFAVAPLTICGGIIADTWPAAGRGPATSLFGASVFLGPVLGPIVGGFIASSSLKWTWVFWVMMMFAGACTALVVVLLPETYAPVLLLQKAKRLRKADPERNADLQAEHEKQDWSATGLLHRTIYRPFKMLALEPILILITIYMSIVYGILYALFQAFPIIFIEIRGFTLTNDGLIFIGVGIGSTLGAVLNYVFSLHYPGLIVKWKGFPPPEQRLFGAMVGAPSLAIGSFWLGWTGHYASIPWYVPAISTILIGAGIGLIFMCFLAYLVDVYMMYSASAFAANTIIRSLVAAAFPLFTVQMYHGLGVNWASTIVGIVALVFAPSPFLFYKYGARIRAYSKFAPCIDLRIAKELEAEESQRDSEKV